MQMREPFILRLPIEVLYDIFNSLTPRGTSLIVHDDFSDVFAVRGSCRTFRAISSTLEFWYNEHFCLTQLIPKQFDSLGKLNLLEQEIRACGLLDCLKADEVLMETMGRRTVWLFSTVSTLVAVAQCIPSFRIRATSICYESLTSDFMPEAASPLPSINFGLAHLGLCQNVTTLSISDEKDDVSLDLIANLYPSLKKLELYSNAGYSGSLQGLGHLEELLVWDYRLDEESPPRQNLYPIDSVSSLTNLTLTYIYGPPENIYNSETLSTFTNLSSCSIIPLCNSICNSLRYANFAHLRKFETTVRIESDISVDQILQILTSQSLSSLQILDFLVEPFIWDFNACYLDIIKAITSHLASTLEELRLTLGVNTAWFEHFSSLCKLKAFSWVVVDEECCDSTDSLPIEGSDDEMSETFRTQMVANVTQKLKDVFRGFEEQPDIYIRMLDQRNYDHWDQINWIT